MMQLMDRWLGAARDLLNRQPWLALALGAALAALFLWRSVDSRREGEPAGLGWAVYRAVVRVLWAMLVVTLVATASTAIQNALAQMERTFRHDHGRVTETNLAAVRTIWGTEQTQGELALSLGYETEETQRIESEDLSRPAVLRKTKKRHEISANPFISSHHAVTIKRSERKKGSGLYPGYEVDCRFTHQLRNPDSHECDAVLKFPLPSAGAIYDGLVVKFDGQDALPQVRMAGGELILEKKLAGNQAFSYEVAYRSRGMFHWSFVVRELRELRDFLLTLTLVDLPVSEWNNPEGCMTATKLAATPDGRGSIATYALDHAIASKGMGIALPTVRQPGALEAAILTEAQKGWIFLFATLLLGLVVCGRRHAEMLTILMSSAVACAWGLTAALHDTFVSFWVGGAIVLLPALALTAWGLRRTLDRAPAVALAAAAVYFTIAYPLLSALDATRQALYLNLSAGVFLALAAWLALAWIERQPTCGISA